jgi:tRNA(Ile2) C34 agmatinyltransferase TiaS
MAAAIRKCPQCRTNTISEGRRICDLCKAENRRKTKSESDRTRNTESDSHS